MLWYYDQFVLVNAVLKEYDDMKKVIKIIKIFKYDLYNKPPINIKLFVIA